MYVVKQNGKAQRTFMSMNAAMAYITELGLTVAMRHAHADVITFCCVR